jgi:hypothetical protein
MRRLLSIFTRLNSIKLFRGSSCGSNARSGQQEQTHTPTYKTRNLLVYIAALERRGSRFIWLDAAKEGAALPTCTCGCQADYSDAALQISLTIKVLSGVALKLPLDLLESLLRPIGLHWTVPNLTTLGLRHRTKEVKSTICGGSARPAVSLD